MSILSESITPEIAIPSVEEADITLYVDPYRVDYQDPRERPYFTKAGSEYLRRVLGSARLTYLIDPDFWVMLSQGLNEACNISLIQVEWENAHSTDSASDYYIWRLRDDRYELQIDMYHYAGQHFSHLLTEILGENGQIEI